MAGVALHRISINAAINTAIKALYIFQFNCLLRKQTQTSIAANLNTYKNNTTVLFCAEGFPIVTRQVVSLCLRVGLHKPYIIYSSTYAGSYSM